MSEREISQETIYTGRIIDLKKYEVELQNGGTAVREVVVHHGGACVVALNEKNQLLMVKQFRFPGGEALWELPAGKLEQGEDPMAAAARELTEETGYSAEQLELMTKMLPTPAYCTEVIYIYRARGLAAGTQNLDEDEFLSVQWVPFAEALDMVQSGAVTDAKTQVGILMLAVQDHD